MKKTLIALIATLAIVVFPAGSAFAAGSQTADAPALTMSANSTVSSAAASDDASTSVYATSPKTGAINLYTVAAGTVVLLLGAGVSAFALRKKLSK